MALHFAVIRPSEHRSAAFQSGPPLVTPVLEGDEAQAMLRWLERQAEQT